MAFLIDGDLRKAMYFSFVAFVFSAIGLIHAEQIGFSLSPITMSYLCLTFLFGLFHVIQPQREVEVATP